MVGGSGRLLEERMLFHENFANHFTGRRKQRTAGNRLAGGEMLPYRPKVSDSGNFAINRSSAHTNTKQQRNGRNGSHFSKPGFNDKNDLVYLACLHCTGWQITADPPSGMNNHVMLADNCSVGKSARGIAVLITRTLERTKG